MTGDTNPYPVVTSPSQEDLLQVRLLFRNLLKKHGLVTLVGSETETVDWLEHIISKLAEAITGRERLRNLVRQVKEVLNRQEAERQQHVNRHVKKRFRRISLDTSD